MDGQVIIGTSLDTKNFEAQIEKLEDKLDNLEEEYEAALKDAKFPEEELKKYASEIEQTKNKIIDLKKKQDELNKSNLSDVFKNINNVGSSMESITKKVIKLGLAIFSVRSAYMLVRQTVNSLSQYDKQMGVNIEYIRYALANTLKPVIETIINLVVKLLTYINYIAKAWFGVNLFANASAKAFQKQKTAVGGVNKEAKKLQKTLAGFDEMNILQKDGSVSSGGGGGGVPLADFDLADIDNIKVPKWIEWIANNKALILDFFKQLAAIIATIKIAQLVLGFANLYGGLAKLSSLQIFGVIAGFALTIVGITKTVEAIINFIKNPSWANFSKIIEGLAITLTGIGISLIAINAANPLGWIAGAAGLLGLVVTAFGDWGQETENVTRKLKDTEEATRQLKDAQAELAQQTSAYASAVKGAEKAQKDLEETERKHKISGEKLFRSVQIGTLSYENLSEVQREVFDAYVMNLEAQGRLSEATRDFTKAQNDLNKASGELSGAVFQETKIFDDYFQELMTGFQNGEVSSKTFYRALNSALMNMDNDTKKVFLQNLPQNIKDGIIKADYSILRFNEVFYAKIKLIAEQSKKTFKEEIPNSIQEGLNPNNYKSTFSRFATNWNNMMKNLTSNIGIKTSITTSKHAAGGIVVSKLASGGIINQPGRGVPLAGAIGGESGREGIIPLTDTQAMSQLGFEIGRNVSINLTNVTELDGRTIARKVQEVNNNTNFLMNR